MLEMNARAYYLGCWSRDLRRSMSEVGVDYWLSYSGYGRLCCLRMSFLFGNIIIISTIGKNPIFLKSII